MRDDWFVHRHADTVLIRSKRSRQALRQPAGPLPRGTIAVTGVPAKDANRSAAARCPLHRDVPARAVDRDVGGAIEEGHEVTCSKRHQRHTHALRYRIFFLIFRYASMSRGNEFS